MPRATVTPDDLKKSAILDPDWYKAVVKDYEYAKSKDGKSYNHVYTFKILEPASAAGVEVKTWFNEKGLGFPEFVQFYEAMSGDKVDRSAGFVVEDFNQAVGQKIEISVKTGQIGDRPTNNINGYRPIGS